MQNNNIIKLSNKNSIQSSIINIISNLLSKICEQYSNEFELEIEKNKKKEILKFFLCKKIPSISIKNFFERICNFCKIENSTLILILIYIDRFCDFNEIQLNYFIIHKLIIASLIISIKFNEDNFYSNKIYAKICGINKEEINKLEIEFLKLIDFNLFVDEEIFFEYSEFCNENE